ncbi:hypothetical protein [Pontibacter sp. BAB1700]|uniref:hypothetical protein n=1 Tax=Pontibacter sp. BAB1700 TaxID=1144253 RepID=UPI00026BDDD8|nr:hypothetical protein [Pontibacter sp. BAB1700]EJF09004.1 hypothetical protein O71_17681 [Pontibacter sp. BAB1700]
MIKGAPTSTLSGADKLFDPQYYLEVDIFHPQPQFTSDMFGGSKSLCGNEKYVRDYTIFEWENCMYRKTGGLLIEGDTCKYQPGFILTSDVLLYRDSEVDMVLKGHAFSDLMICAIHDYDTGAVCHYHLSLFLRSISTGEFFVIAYDYSTLYTAEYLAEISSAHPSETLLDLGYPFYYARRIKITEEDLVNASNKYDDFMLFNLDEYRSRARIYKIDKLFGK